MKVLNFSKSFSVLCLLGSLSGANAKSGASVSALNFETINVTSEDRQCRNVPLTLRQFFYDSFKRAAPRMNAEQGQAAVARYSKMLAMAVEESSGNAACITDMKARGSAASDRMFFANNRGRSMGSALQANLNIRSDLLSLTNIKWDKQTNFGVLQMSADRLTASKNRDVYRKYQRVAHLAPAAAVKICGAQFLYQEAANVLAGELEDAASCEANYGTLEGIKCYAGLVTLCPALNLELGMNASSAYFASRNASPRCASAFREVLASVAE